MCVFFLQKDGSLAAGGFWLLGRFFVDAFFYVCVHLAWRSRARPVPFLSPAAAGLLAVRKQRLSQQVL